MIYTDVELEFVNKTNTKKKPSFFAKLFNFANKAKKKHTIFIHVLNFIFFYASGRVDDLATELGKTMTSIAIGSEEGFAQADGDVHEVCAIVLQAQGLPQ